MAGRVGQSIWDQSVGCTPTRGSVARLGQQPSGVRSDPARSLAHDFRRLGETPMSTKHAGDFAHRFDASDARRHAHPSVQLTHLREASPSAGLPYSGVEATGAGAGEHPQMSPEQSQRLLLRRTRATTIANDRHQRSDPGDPTHGKCRKVSLVSLPPSRRRSASCHTRLICGRVRLRPFHVARG